MAHRGGRSFLISNGTSFGAHVRETAAAQAQVRFFSASNALAKLGSLQAGLPALREKLNALRAGGQGLAYPLTLAPLEVRLLRLE